MPGSIKIDDGSGNYTILTNAGSLGSDKTITIPNTTGTAALTSDVKFKQLVVADGDNSGEETTQAAYPIVTSLTASITPTSTSSKILILVQCVFRVQFVSGGAVTNRDAKIGINRGNSASEGSTANGTDLKFVGIGARTASSSTGEAAHFASGAWIFKDEPNTTSSTSYTLTHGIFNTNVVSKFQNQSDRGQNYIMLMEI